MRKVLAVLVAAGLAASLIALPAAAAGKGKKKRIEDSFTATLLPFPKLATWGDPVGLTEPGCNSGQEGVHKQTVAFEAPAAGTFSAHMTGFTGDWDLHITDPDGHAVLSSQNDQIQGGAEAEEEVTLALKAKQTIGIVACNWAGLPQAEVHYVFEYPVKKKKGSKHHH
ncbi:MAG TPA: hypothetical protein VM573_08145 [Actinomycetota bacterium]|jgi:hypothetical protein|nr:hypothetical protein [Actinomycetota bacterium]